MSLVKGVIPPLNTAVITVDSTYAIGWELTQCGLQTIANAGAFPAANNVYYVPFWVPEPLIAYKGFVHSGAASGGHVDVGIYSWSGTTLSRLTNAGNAIASSGTGTSQQLDFTDVALSPGTRYMMAMWCDSTSPTWRRANTTAPWPAAFGVMTETGASSGMPSTATPTFDQAGTYIPHFGISTRSYV